MGYEHYFIALIDKDGMDWCILESSDYDYIYRVFENMSAPPEYDMELRGTTEDIDTYFTWDVLRYDRR